jgi:hypothetical protein
VPTVVIANSRGQLAQLWQGIKERQEDPVSTEESQQSLLSNTDNMPEDSV